MKEEMASIEQNKTWALVDLPSGHKPTGLKLVFKVKRDEKSAVVKHKAHLVAKGYVQREGFDFEEVFVPVARLDSVRLLLAVAVQEKWELHHLDVKVRLPQRRARGRGVRCSAPWIRHGWIEGEGAATSQGTLRASSSSASVEREAGHQPRRTWLHHAVYTRSKDGERFLLGVYVINLIIIGASPMAIGDFKKEMTSMFRMSDLGLLTYYLGI
jgi:hypothetical protein